MKVVTERSQYLENKAKENIIFAVLFGAIGTLLILYSFFFIYYASIPYGIALYFIGRYLSFKSGISGEESVIDQLKGLPDSFYLLNDVKVGFGNIDHIVIGDNGIFVIETKNFEGEITCNGDIWTQYKYSWKRDDAIEIKSPSKQVKRNAVKLKEFLLGNAQFKTKEKIRKIFIDGIVLITNPRCNVSINTPTVNVMGLNELKQFILNKKSNILLTKNEIEEIVKLLA